VRRVRRAAHLRRGHQRVRAPGLVVRRPALRRHPDLLIFAKGVTSGYMPLGGVFVGPQCASASRADPSFILAHGTTYAGHPSCCAAGLANLEILRREDLPPARGGRPAPARRAGRARRPPGGPRGSAARASCRHRPRGAARPRRRSRGAARAAASWPARSPTPTRSRSRRR
jgi:hypothetical protein